MYKRQAIQFIASPEVLQKAGIQDAGYVVYYILANNFGINGKVIVQVYAAINLITSIAAYITVSYTHLSFK